jgi:AcrR family transcriptional regulator
MARSTKLRRKTVASSRRRDRARHEAEVLDAAERLFARRGFTDTTIAEVAAEAGFSVATLYNLFGSKDAIFTTLLENHFEAFEVSVSAALRAAKTPREKLVASVLARARYCEEHRSFFTLFAESYSSLPSRAARQDAASARMERKIRDELGRLERIFRELPHAKLDVPARALAFYGATRAFIVERVLRSEKPARPDQIATLVSSLLDGLA